MGVMEKLLESTTFGVGGAHYVYYKRGMHKEGGPVVRDSIDKLMEHANVKSLANKYFKDMRRMSPSHKGISKKLMALAQQEREKEELVLRRLDPNKRTRYSQMGDGKFINKLNEFLGMGEKYKDYMRYLQEIYPNNQAKNLSPMVTSYFNQYFAQILSSDEFMNELSKRVQKIVLNNGTQTEIDAACQNIGDWVADKFMANGADNRIFDEFIKKVEQTNHTLGEQEMFWVDIFEKIKQDEAVRNEFMSSILQSYNIAGILQKTIKSIKIEQDSKKMLSKGNIKKEINTSLRSTAYVKGGLYYEAVAVALQALNLQGLGKGTVMGSSKITNAATTDSVALYTGELSVELRSELEKKYTELLETSANEKQKGIKVVRDFTKWVNENLKGSVLIYSNTKSYKLSSLSTGKKFFSGGRRKLSNLTDLITLDGGTVENADSFIDLIINTIPGAIYDGKQAEIKTQLSAILAQNIANLLFDDWETIGLQDATAMVDNNQNMAIHVFPLSGVMVPLSYLLEKAAKAFEKAETNMVLESNEYFRINFDLPNNIHFQDPKDTTAFINEYFNKHKPKGDVVLSKKEVGKIRTQGLVEAWKLQSAEAMSGSSFGVDFLSNFNNLLQELNDLL